MNVVDAVREMLGDSPLLAFALNEREDLPAPIGVCILLAARRMPARELTVDIADDKRRIEAGAKGDWRLECQLRVALMTAELERRES
jgi:hypothetical protein